jgi:hypothetical protein
MRTLRLVFFSILLFGLMGVLYSFKALSSKNIIYQVNSTISPKAQELLDVQVLNPLKAMHDPANIKMFSRAYIGSVWKSEMISKPAGKQKYYDMELREYKGAFIIDQYKMRIFEADGKVMLEDWKTGTFLTADKWLDFYKNQKNTK